MKMEHNFILKFQHAEPVLDMAIESLYTNCNDAIIGIGKPNVIALDFTREGEDREHIINNAIKDVLTVLPTAKLLSIN